MHNAKCYFTLKQVSRQNENFNLLSVNKFSVQNVKHKTPFLEFTSDTWILIHTLAYDEEQISNKEPRVPKEPRVFC